ncbi:hypothetical protein BDR05DRAFT_999405 [Suillus weaverae]|nr:hypothetical protein BDR05DRAFT_999405 [Suillus weaverae]
MHVKKKQPQAGSSKLAVAHPVKSVDAEPTLSTPEDDNSDEEQSTLWLFAGLGAKPAASCPVTPAHPPIPDGLITMEPGETCIKDPSPPPCAATLFEPAASASDGMQRSLDALDAISHEIHLRLVAEERADKGTNDAYARHVRNYVAYWDGYQAEMVADNSAWTSVPALPISAAKVLIFLNYE